MRKLTLFIEGDNKEVQLAESILVSGDSPHLLAKPAVVYWNYNNVFKGYNEYVNGSQGRVSLIDGYWTFKMPVDKLKPEGINFGG